MGKKQGQKLTEVQLVNMRSGKLGHRLRRDGKPVKQPKRRAREEA